MSLARAHGLIVAALVAGCGVATGDGKSELWAGSLQLCAGTVEVASEEEDALTGERILVATLNAEAARHFSRMTARLIDKPLPIKLGDKVLMEPVVNERITGGVIQIGPLPQEDLDRALLEMSEAC